MGYKLKGTTVELPVSPKRGSGEKKPVKRVFEQYRDIQIERLMVSLENHDGRYERNERLDKNYAAPNWRVVQEGTVGDQMEDPDTVAVFFKVGTKKWAIFGEDGSSNESLIYSIQLKDELEGMMDFIEGLTESSDEGKSFLNAAIATKSIKAKYKYNPESGLMDLGKK